MTPITITSRIEFEDYERSQAVLYNPNRLNRLLAAFMGLCFVVIVLTEIFPPEPSKGSWTPPHWPLFYGGCAAVMVVFFLVVPPWTYRRGLRQFYDRDKSLQEEFTAVISEEGIYGRTAIHESNTPWDHFSRWKCTDDVVLLFDSDVVYRLLPRRAFASQQDYDAAREFLTRKLGPADKKAPAWLRGQGPVWTLRWPAREGPRSSPAPAPEAGAPAAERRMNPVSITGRIEFDDYERAQHVFFNARRFNLLVVLCTAAVLACLLLWQCYSGLNRRGWSQAEFALYYGAVTALLAAYLFIYGPWTGRRKLRRLYDQQKALHAEFTVVFCEDCIEGRSPLRAGKTPWDHFCTWKSTDEMLVVFEPNSRMQIYPRRAFASQQDYDAARELLTRKLGPATK